MSLATLNDDTGTLPSGMISNAEFERLVTVANRDAAKVRAPIELPPGYSLRREPKGRAWLCANFSSDFRAKPADHRLCTEVTFVARIDGINRFWGMQPDVGVVILVRQRDGSERPVFVPELIFGAGTRSLCAFLWRRDAQIGETRAVEKRLAKLFRTVTLPTIARPLTVDEMEAIRDTTHLRHRTTISED